MNGSFREGADCLFRLNLYWRWSYFLSGSSLHAGKMKTSSNGVTKKASNGSISVTGVDHKVSRGATDKARNGSAAGTTLGVMNGRPSGISIGKVNGSASTDVVIPNVNTAKRMLQAPIDLAKYENPVRVLPSDEGFSWSKDNYSATQRQIDIWSFVLTLRARVWLLDAKWTYVGGFNEEKQVSTVLAGCNQLHFTSIRSSPL